MDKISKEHRSWNMGRIKSKNTKPELTVRSVLHYLGYRFRLNGYVGKKYAESGLLPGKPDIVLAKYRLAIFVNGCFWHRHSGCTRAGIPKTNVEYWNKKILNNIERDKRNYAGLSDMGWKIVVIWECETHKIDFLIYLENKIHERINSRQHVFRNWRD